MAKRKIQALGVDIGTHSIRVAEVTFDGSQVEIKSLLERRLEIEEGLNEAEHQSSIISQLNALLKDNKIKTKQAVFCVPGQTVFVRQTKLPKTDPERLEQIIRFEAKEQIPFPLEKTKLEYQVFKGELPTEVDVLLVAVKRDYIANYMMMVSKTGLKPLAVSVSSLALHNFYELNEFGGDFAERASIADKKNKKNKKKAQKKSKKGRAKAGDEDEGEQAPEEKGKKRRFSMPKLGRKKAKKVQAPAEETPEAPGEDNEPYESMELEEIRAEVNLGASTMDLAIPRAGAQRLIGFTRTVPIAGGHMDRGIMKKLSLSTIEEATRLKEEEAVILSAEFEETGDRKSVNTQASEAATVVADSILTEIRRSLDFFISQPDGVAVDAVSISGGMARMRFLRDYFEEKLGFPVVFPEIKNSRIVVGDELVDKISRFTIPLGLAFQGVGLGQIQIDFLPQEYKNIRQFKSKRNFVASAVALSVVAIAIGSQIGSTFMAQTRSLALRYEEYVKDNEEQTTAVDQAMNTNKSYADRFGDLDRVQGDRAVWLDVVLTLLESRPGDVLIESLQINNSGEIILLGRTSRREGIMELLDALKEHAETAEVPLVLEAKLRGGLNPIEDARFNTLVIPFQLRILSFDRRGRYRSLKRDSSGKTLGEVIEGEFDELREEKEKLKKEEEAKSGGRKTFGPDFGASG